MAITTVSGIVTGAPFNTREWIIDNGALSQAGADRWRAPSVAIMDVPTLAFGTPGVDGVNVDGTTDSVGLRHFNPPSGNAYIHSIYTHWSQAASDQTSPPDQMTVWLLDLMWYNTGLVVTTTTVQSFTQPTLPARDRNGATSGDGVWAGLLALTNLGAGANSVMTLDYTNSAGTTGRTATMSDWPSAMAAGHFQPFNLQEGDLGVRSIQSITLNSSLTSGTIALVCFRPITLVMPPKAGLYGKGHFADAFRLGLPRLYNGTSLFPLVKANGVNPCHVFQRINHTYG